MGYGGILNYHIFIAHFLDNVSVKYLMKTWRLYGVSFFLTHGVCYKIADVYRRKYDAQYKRASFDRMQYHYYFWYVNSK